MSKAADDSGLEPTLSEKPATATTSETPPTGNSSEESETTEIPATMAAIPVQSCSIPKLTDNNYNSWKNHMTWLLDSLGLKSLIESSVTTDGAPNGKALLYISVNLSDHLQHLVDGKATAYDAWVAIKNHFEKEDPNWCFTLIISNS